MTKSMLSALDKAFPEAGLLRRRSPLEELAEIRRFCQFCHGKGCFDCDAKTKRKEKVLAAEYAAQFPNGPEPILTIPLATHVEIEQMNAEGCPNDPPRGNILADCLSRMSAEDRGKLDGILAAALKPDVENA